MSLQQSLSTSPDEIALLGVTGDTGRVLLRKLLENDQHDLRVYARSQEKVIQMFPGIESNPRVKLYIGSMENQELMRSLLSQVQTIVCTLGSKGFAPVSVMRQGAQAIVATLKQLRHDQKIWQAPRVIWLSSSSKNERFSAARPSVVDWLIKTAFQNGYIDLQGAHDLLLAHPDLLSVLFVQPGLLVNEEGTGFEISVDSVRMAASYEDLGAAFMELALDRQYESLNRIGVSSVGGNRGLRYAPIILFRLCRGIFTFYVPFGVAIDKALGRVYSLLPG